MPAWYISTSQWGTKSVSALALHILQVSKYWLCSADLGQGTSREGIGGEKRRNTVVGVDTGWGNDKQGQDEMKEFIPHRTAKPSSVP